MGKAIFAVLGLILLLAAGLAWIWKRPAGPTEADRPRPEIKHVILLTIDTLRADALPFHGNTRIATPNLTGLSRHAVVFDRALAPSPWTRPTITSILTGLPPAIHAAADRDILVEAVLPESVKTLTECMRDSDRKTVALGYNPFLAYSPNTKRGFQQYYFYPTTVKDGKGGRVPCNTSRLRFSAGEGGARNVDTLIDSKNSTWVLTELATSWLAANAGEKYFLWLHYFDPHKPYLPPKESYAKLPEVRARQSLPDDASYTAYLRRINDEFDDCLNAERKLLRTADTPEVREKSRSLIAKLMERKQEVRALYDAEVMAVDTAVGRVLDTLKKTGVYEDALIIVTSDHGEEFGEHGGFEHGHTLYQELLHVPLIIKPPGGRRPHRVKERVSVMSIYPTILELCSLSPPAFGVPMPSLVPLWETGGGSLRPPRFIADSLMYGEEGSAVLFDNMKYIIRGGDEELYDLASDPGEKKSLAATDVRSVERARKTLDAGNTWSMSCKKRIWSGGMQTSEKNEQIRKLLRSHGYIK